MAKLTPIILAALLVSIAFLSACGGDEVAQTLPPTPPPTPVSATDTPSKVMPEPTAIPAGPASPTPIPTWTPVPAGTTPAPTDTPQNR